MTHIKEVFFTTPESLLSFCSLSLNEAPYPIASATVFSFRVPLNYARQIKKADWFDPLLLQVLPRAEENSIPPVTFSKDPVADTIAVVAPGLLHKYHGRVLLLASSSCAIHCRYCFRRQHCCPALPQDGSGDASVLDYIKNNPSVNEVILSGGDPFTLSNERLQQLVSTLASFDHITTLRIHTRVPIVLPERIDNALVTLFTEHKKRFRCVIVVQVNHAREISDESLQAVTALRDAGALLLNQSVLLKEINDTVDALAALSQSLLTAEIVPYYLHQLDRVCGAQHFEVDEDDGKRLVAALRERLPGYAVPRYVKEVPGEKAKRGVV